MNDKISFSFPITPSATVKEGIEAAILENQGDFYLYFRRLIDKGDARTTLDDDSMRILDLVVGKDGGVATLEMDWTYFDGCKDRNASGTEEGIFDFAIECGELKFEIDLPLVWRNEPEDY